MKEKILSVFFLVLACILASKVLNSEFYFVVKLLIGFVTIGLSLFVFYLLRPDSKNLATFKKKLLIFTFFSISFFIVRYIFEPKFFNSFFEETISEGLILFILYIAFFLIFELDFKINSLVSLISLSLIPAFALGNINYSAETFGVFGYLTLVLSGILMILKLRTNYGEA